MENPENTFRSNVLGNFLQKLKLNSMHAVKVLLVLAEFMMANRCQKESVTGNLLIIQPQLLPLLSLYQSLHLNDWMLLPMV